MSGTFIIHLFDLLAYLFPGSLMAATLLVALSQFPAGSQVPELVKQDWFLFAFFIVSYILGHNIFSMSEWVSKMDWYLNGRQTMTERSIKQADFYPALLVLVKKYVKLSNLDNADVLAYCNRITCEKMPCSSIVVDRGYAIMLFSRSMAMCCLLMIPFIVGFYIQTPSPGEIVLIAVLLICLYSFFKRYKTSYQTFLLTVWRSAYLWLIEQERGNKQQ